MLCVPLWMHGRDDGGVVFVNSLKIKQTSMRINDPIVTDSIDYALDYNVYYISDTTNSTDLLEDLYRLEIGKRRSRFYSRIEYVYDSLATASDPNLTREERAARVRPYKHYSPLYWEVVEDREHNTYTTLYRSPSWQVVFYAYEVKREAPRWTLTDEIRDICGYRCFQARTSYGGREWIVYYAPDLPLNSAVWKFYGLPGFVLAFEDTEGHYKFECSAIRVCRLPMIEYKQPIQKVTRKNWMQQLRSIHADLLNSIYEGNKVYYKPKMNEKAERLTSWSIPYNPIERE